jgi:hypothetical protein
MTRKEHRRDKVGLLRLVSEVDQHVMVRRDGEPPIVMAAEVWNALPIEVPAVVDEISPRIMRASK